MDKQKIKILIIDDIVEDIEAISIKLRKSFENVIIYSATEGISGIEVARMDDPDIILLDILMPGIDGFEVCKRLKSDEITKDIPVVFLSVIQAEKESRLKALEVGADAFLSKPIDSVELIAQVRVMYKIRMALREKNAENQGLRKILDELSTKYKWEQMERTQLETILFKQISNLPIPENDLTTVTFTDLFNIVEIQKIQDDFAFALNIASLITFPDGTPITKPSNFCRLCRDVIRSTKQGCINCHKSDAIIGSYNPDGPTIRPCLSGGLWDAGVSISVGGKHLANWMIGQIKNEAQNRENMLAYADEIGADRELFSQALDEVPSMSYEQFEKIAGYLFSLSKLISHQASQNFQQARYILKRKEAEHALILTKQSYIDIFNTVSEAIYIQDPETGVFIDVNKGAENMYGMAAHEIIGKTPFDVAAPGLNNLAEIWEKSREVFLTGVPVRFDFWAVRKNGEIFPKEVIVNKGQYFGKDVLIATARDISEQKRNQKILQKQESLLRSLIENAPFEVWARDHKNIGILENQKLVEHFGSILGKTPNPVEISPDDYHRWISNNLRVFNGEIITEECDYYVGNDLRKYQQIIFPIINDTQTIGIAGFNIDVTEHSQARDRMTKLTNCLLGFGSDTDANINSLVALCGETLGAVCALYNKLETNMLCSIGQWQTPPGYNPVDNPEGHICYDLIKLSDDQPLLIRNLQSTRYQKSDPNVAAYNLQTYLGIGIKVRKQTIGSLCVVYQKDYNPSKEEIDYLGIIGYAIGIEEDRKLVEQNLKNSYLHKKALLDAIPDMMFVFDHDGTIIDFHSNSNDALYAPPEVFLGKKPEEVLPKEIADMTISRVKAVLKTGQPDFNVYDLEINGVTMTFESRGVPYGENQVLSIVRDITEQIASERALRENELFIKTVTESSPDIIYVFDVIENRNTYFNRSIVQFLGYDQNELDEYGTGFFNLVIHPDDLEQFELCYKNIDTFDENFSFSFEYRMKTRKGEWRWFRGNEKQFQVENGKVVSLIGTIQDITDLKKTENIRKVQHSISAAVAETSDLQRFMVFVQNQLHTLIDATNFFVAFYDESTGMLSTPYFSDELDQTEVWPAEKSLTGLVIFTAKPLLLKRSDIDDLFLEGKINIVGERSECWLGVPMVADGKVIGAFVVQSYSDPNAYSTDDMQMLGFMSQNVSIALQRIKKDNEIRSALAKAQESDELKTFFLQNMSHEIRTPLNGIIGFASLIADNMYQPNELKHYALTIRNSGNRLLDLFNNIMEISKLDAGTAEIQYGIVSPMQLIREVIEQFSDEAARNSIHLKINTNKSPDLSIKSDQKKLHQIISNLVSNSLKFTRVGSIETGFHLENNSVLFFVKDTGIGITSDNIEKIFDRFYQADISISRGHEGAGLGLPICKGLVELFNGKIWVESEPGAGSTFYFSVPCEIVNYGSEEKPKESTIPKSMINKPLKVLIAEDEYVNFQFASVVLKSIGCMVLHAGNGAEAVELCRSNDSIDLVLMDMKMPLMDGFIATRNIRSFNQTIPIIAITAYALSGDRERALNAGCNDYLAKPVKKSDIIRSIEKLVLKQ